MLGPTRGRLTTPRRVGFAVVKLEAEFAALGHALAGRDDGAVGVADDGVAAGQDGFEAGRAEAMAELVKLLARDAETCLGREAMEFAAELGEAMAIFRNDFLGGAIEAFVQ